MAVKLQRAKRMRMFRVLGRVLCRVFAFRPLPADRSEGVAALYLSRPPVQLAQFGWVGQPAGRL